MEVLEKPYRSNAQVISDHMANHRSKPIKADIYIDVRGKIILLAKDQKIVRGGWTHPYWLLGKCKTPVRKITKALYEVCTYADAR